MSSSVNYPYAPTAFNLYEPVPNVGWQLNDEISDRLTAIQDVAERLVGKPIDHQSSIQRGWEIPFFHYWPSYHYHSYSSDKGKKDTRGAIVAFGICTLFASYFLGKEWGKWQGAKKGIKQIEKFNALNISAKVFYEIDIKNKETIEKVVTKAEKQFSKMKRDSRSGVIRRTTLLASAIIGLFGALAAAPELVAVGTVGLFTTSCVMLFKFASNQGRDEQRIKKLRDVQTEINQLKLIKN